MLNRYNLRVNREKIQFWSNAEKIAKVMSLSREEVLDSLVRDIEFEAGCFKFRFVEEDDRIGLKIEGRAAGNLHDSIEETLQSDLLWQAEGVSFRITEDGNVLTPLGNKLTLENISDLYCWIENNFMSNKHLEKLGFERIVWTG